jgi:hypothetical protein
MTLSWSWGLKSFQNFETVTNLIFRHRFDDSLNSAVLLLPFLGAIAGNRLSQSITDSG